MCGFVGVFDYKNKVKDFESILWKMNDEIHHRGPDNGNIHIHDNLGLGFRRLSILDLSSDGNQPMKVMEDRYVIVFNGEIYNYVELKNKLIEEKGIDFRTGTDTEVIVHLYHQYGEKCLDLLNGMFVFVVYDKLSGNVFIARDRLGVKPLFLYKDDEKIAFASELKAFQNIDIFRKKRSDEALSFYFRLGYIPTSLTIYENFSKLPPASYISFNIDQCQELDIYCDYQKYWSIDYNQVDYSLTEDDWIEKIDNLLFDATRIRLRSDVPIATFLSGGIDSSLVTYYASRVIGAALKSLTLEIPNFENNESELAKQTIEKLKIDGRIQSINSFSLNLLESLSGHFDEPFSDTSMIPTYIISKEMKKLATVALSGDGGDEVFAGYQSHIVADKMRILKKFPNLNRQFFIPQISRLLPKDSYLRRNFERLTLKDNEYFAWLQRNLFENWPEYTLKEKYKSSYKTIVGRLDQQLGYYKIDDPVLASQYADQNLVLPDDMLVKVDRMSMKASLEVRSPFLDYRVVELGAKIPPHIKLKNRDSKYLLKQIIMKYGLNHLTDQPKRGFSLPVKGWLFNSDEGKDIKSKLVNWPEVDDSCPYTVKGIKKLFSRAENNLALVNPIYRLICLYYWQLENK
jgi:asparagine synthase (glutamine-hydrolysing)